LAAGAAAAGGPAAGRFRFELGGGDAAGEAAAAAAAGTPAEYTGITIEASEAKETPWYGFAAACGPPAG
jgi:hypothetical protein